MGTNTGLGIGIGIPFKNNALGGDKPYFPPELKARMIGVWTNYGKKNTDTDRNIIKNKIPNAGGDLEILNAAYKLNSGFGKYSEDFTTWTKSSKITSVDSESFDFITNVNWALLSYKSYIGKDISSFKVRIKLKGKGKVYYNYITLEGVYTTEVITSEEYVTPISYNTKYTGETPVNCGFTIGIISDECSGTITQIPNFEDAFVSDGINDMIVSQKTLQEMGVTKELTIVSMIHQISFRNSTSVPLTNYIRNGDTFIRNSISNIGKTGIYGYTCFNIKNVNSSASKVINNILGDKNDYIVEYRGDILSERFSVQGYIDGNGNILETSSVAHYWTFAVLGKVTEDEINLIIGNYNLDRSLKPDILCNIGKQGITNDNHADFNDKLIDYSGNGRDIQMYNLAWKGGSGIAAKQYETFKDWTSESSSTSIIKQIDEFTRIVESTTNGYWVSRIRRDSDLDKVYNPINVYLYQDNNFLVHECKYEVDGVKYAIPINEPVGKGYHKLEMYTKDRYTELPENAENVVLSEWYFPKSTKGSIKYSIIPSCKGGILLDGINDFGKVTGMPIYKDYTVIVDYERISGIEQAWAEALISKSYIANQGAFVLMETNGTAKHSYSFGAYTTFNKDDSTRTLLYQSKYKCGNVDLNVGTGIDRDTLWLGTYRDNYSSFFNGAIYSLMSFPYSMSEFLIERQLKKHKLGTLYPDMVEFRPIVESNVKYQDIIFRNISTGEDLVAGQYYDLEAISIFIKPNNIDEVSNVRVNNTNAQFHSYDSNSGYYHYYVLINKSPQKINITIDEYIRYEDIVQPYPVLLRFNDENGNEVSWGGKFKVGSTITRIGSAADSNLLPNIYNIFGLLLNDNQVTSSKVIVEKTMVFKAKSAYIFDNNEPKCILSPSRLRISNSSYKLLGYIPDISGHGNHGKINNSAYAGASGANGYLLDFKTFTTGNSSLVNIKDDSIIEVINTNKEKGSTYINLNKHTSTNLSSWKIKVTGMKSGDTLGYYYSESTDDTLKSRFGIEQDGIYSLPSSVANSNNIGGIAFDVVAVADSAYRIEQIGEYEGAYCLDGVDDFVTIPTVTGGKQMLMKVNWQKSPTLLYDQRASGSFAVLTTLEDDAVNSRIAYQGRNPNGKTYIDGIENNNIETYTLKDITHNITIANSSLGGVIVPVIGCNTGKTSNFAKMSLYDFMLFDEISTDDKIKELNEYVGIEAKVELPPYYWDAYGKTNLDADKATIQQRGVAVGDYDLTNYNHAYEGMSGYNGYPVVFGANKTWESLSGVYGYTSDVTNTTIHVTHAEHAGNGLLFSYVKKDGALANIKEIPAFRVTIGGLEGNSKFGYRYLATEDATGETLVYLGNGTHELAKSFAPTEALLDLTRNVWVGIFITPMVEGEVVFDCDITIEVLPEYENGLAYDGITDFSDNKNVPIIDDFTAIAKRTWLEVNTSDKPFIIKGDTLYPDGKQECFLI